MHACLLSNIHLTQQLTKGCVFSSVFLVCSILLNAYDTPTEHVERVTFDLEDLTIGPGVLVMRVSKNESVHSCPTTIKRCKRHNPRGRDTNH